MPKNISAATLMVLSACIIWGAQADVRHFCRPRVRPDPSGQYPLFYSRRSAAGSAGLQRRKTAATTQGLAAAVFDGRPQRWRQQCCAIYRPAILTVANLTIIASLTPAVTALLSLVLLHERLHKLQWLRYRRQYHRRRLPDQQRFAFNDYQPEL